MDGFWQYLGVTCPVRQGSTICHWCSYQLPAAPEDTIRLTEAAPGRQMSLRPWTLLQEDVDFLTTLSSSSICGCLASGSGTSVKRRSVLEELKQCPEIDPERPPWSSYPWTISIQIFVLPQHQYEEGTGLSDGETAVTEKLSNCLHRAHGLVWEVDYTGVNK